MAKAVFEGGEDRFLVAGFDIDNAVGVQADLGQSRCKERRLPHSQQYRSALPRTA